MNPMPGCLWTLEFPTPRWRNPAGGLLRRAENRPRTRASPWRWMAPCRSSTARWGNQQVPSARLVWKLLIPPTVRWQKIWLFFFIKLRNAKGYKYPLHFYDMTCKKIWIFFHIKLRNAKVNKYPLHFYDIFSILFSFFFIIGLCSKSIS